MQLDLEKLNRLLLPKLKSYQRFSKFFWNADSKGAWEGKKKICKNNVDFSLWGTYLIVKSLIHTCYSTIFSFPEHCDDIVSYESETFCQVLLKKFKQKKI